jgi:hypothetical protein
MVLTSHVPILLMSQLIWMIMLMSYACANFKSDDVEGKSNCESPIKKPCLKSWFFDIDEEEIMENMNKGGQRVMKHA